MSTRRRHLMNEDRKKDNYRNRKDSNVKKERIPFLVPLMMVPENQVGIDKDISFAKPPTQPNRMRPNQAFNMPRRGTNLKRPGIVSSPCQFIVAIMYQ